MEVRKELRNEENGLMRCLLCNAVQFRPQTRCASLTGMIKKFGALRAAHTALAPYRVFSLHSLCGLTDRAPFSSNLDV
jgi:hypothetical protein